MADEHVVLVDEHDTVVGTMLKAVVHHAATPLHRGFSAFIFRTDDKRLLLQQRSAHKITWPLVWSNSCCGHPRLGESNVDAARRRLLHELALDPAVLEEAAPYRYCATRDGIVENEICPILIGLVAHEPVPNPAEVEAIRWVEWSTFVEEIRLNPRAYSEWCIEQAGILPTTARWVEVTGLPSHPRRERFVL